jgi:hypothetical protein
MAHPEQAGTTEYPVCTVSAPQFTEVEAISVREGQTRRVSVSFGAGSVSDG